jgi:hypothetical protein
LLGHSHGFRNFDFNFRTFENLLIPNLKFDHFNWLYYCL